MTTLYTGGLRPYPGCRPEHAALAEQVLTSVRSALATSGLQENLDALEEPVPGADYEDFWEDAVRMAAAWEATAGDMTVLDTTDGRSLVLRQLAAWGGDRLGPVLRLEEEEHPRDVLLDALVASEASGRAMVLGGISPDDPSCPDAATWMAGRALAGARRVVVKLAQRKSGVHALPVSTSIADNEAALLRALDWEYVRLEGAPGSLLLQDWVDMRFETRFFAVDGSVVTAAGCVEELTPLDHDPARFPGRETRGYTGAPASPVVETPAETLATLRALAEETARLHGGTVVVDCAIDAATGDPLVVELNDLPNSGLYACNAWALAEALVGARDRGYAVPIN